MCSGPAGHSIRVRFLGQTCRMMVSHERRRATLLTQLRHWSLPEVAAQHPSWYPAESMRLDILSIMRRAMG
jgi:hypothetical protein